MRSLALVLPLALAACANGEADTTTIGVGDVTDLVPDTHILSMSRQPHQFVRLKPPERTFELVYDSRTSAHTDRFGWPVIFSLNDERARNIGRTQVGN